MLLVLVLAGVPVLLRHSGLSWVDAGLTSLHVAVDLDGILSAALVRVDEVLAWLGNMGQYDCEFLKTLSSKWCEK